MSSRGLYLCTDHRDSFDDGNNQLRPRSPNIIVQAYYENEEGNF